MTTKERTLNSPFPMLAAYNAWANRRLYDAAAALPDADYRADRGAFFKSVHGTLNHLLVADRIWMRRFTGAGEHPNRLDAILFEDLSELRAAREAEDGRIAAYIERPHRCRPRRALPLPHDHESARHRAAARSRP